MTALSSMLTVSAVASTAAGIADITAWSSAARAHSSRPAAVGPKVCVLPPTMQILMNATCDSLAPLATTTVDLAGMANEMEHAQLLIHLPPSSPPMIIASVRMTSISPASASIRQVGYVNTSTTSRYVGSGGGWRPDPLLELDPAGTLVEPGVATPLWLSFKLAGTVSGTVDLTFTSNGQQPEKLSVSVDLTTWHGLALPSPLELHKDFGEIWSWNEHDIQVLYNDAFTNDTAARFRRMNTYALLPPDNLYKRTPYDASTYDSLRKDGAYLLNIGDLGTDARGCPSAYTPEQLQQKLDLITPAIEALGPSSPDFRPYVYGYDEQPESCEANIRSLYGAIKAKWPHVATAAVLNWKDGLPADLPLDVWIVQYGVWEASKAAAWQAIKGKQLFGYHCIEPSGPLYLNTFIERPRTHGRLLYWWAADRNVDGWLYYATDVWRPRPGSKHAPMRRIRRSPKTDFDPSNYIWAPRTDIFANGDGQFVYPGVDAADNATPAPVASARLELQRDAVEDAHLLRLARKTLGANATSAFIRQLVRSPTDHTDDPALLEKTRRALAAKLSEELGRQTAVVMVQ